LAKGRPGGDVGDAPPPEIRIHRNGAKAVNERPLALGATPKKSAEGAGAFGDKDPGISAAGTAREDFSELDHSGVPLSMMFKHSAFMTWRAQERRHNNGAHRCRPIMSPLFAPGPKPTISRRRHRETLAVLSAFDQHGKGK